FELARTIPGFRDGVVGMEVGETKTIVVPPEQGYGANPVLDSQNNVLIPANSTLTFVVTLLDIIE
ncbi:MAG: FKBP-type peptidyl-prolyl cis-trans isomerase, partial [Bacteroidota bacterium]